MQDQLSLVGVVKHLIQFVSILARSAKQCPCLVLFWWMTISFQLTNSRQFSLIVAFNWFNCEECLNSMTDFAALNTQCLSNITKYTAWLYLNVDWFLDCLMVVHFLFPISCFAPHCCKQYNFHYLWSSFQIYFFLVTLSKNQIEMWLITFFQLFFFSVKSGETQTS